MTSDELTKEGILFVESIPDSWCLIPNKWLFLYDGHKVGKNWADYDLLSLTKEGVKTKSKESTGGKVPESYDGYQTVKPGQMIFCLFDLDVSAVFSGISNLQGMITSAYDVYSSTNLINNEFADYWFKYVFSSRYYKLYSKNIRYTITSDNFGMIKTPIPPLKIQEKIAAFLKSKEEKINALITNEEKQIEKLKAYKQALISEVVTKGLDPNVPMKDSGVEWIGKIPYDWRISKIKFCADIFGRIGFRGYTESDLVSESEAGAITLSPTNFNNMKMNYSKVTYLSWHKYYESPEIMIQNGDVLFVKTGSSYGKSSLVVDLPKEATINPQLIVFKNIKQNKKMFSYIIQSQSVKFQTELIVTGGTIPTMSQEKIKNFIIVDIPTFEQKEIVNFLDSKCGLIDSIIDCYNSKIEKLKQYRQSVIYEYVTGKRKVY